MAINKIICVFLLSFCFSCKSHKIKSQTSILITYVNDVLVNKPYSLGEKYSKNGIRLNSNNNNNWIIEYLNENEIKGIDFYPRISDSVLESLFNKKAIEHYHNQFLEDNLNLNNIDFSNSKIKIKVYSESILDIKDNYKLPIINVSKPVFSLKNEYAILFTSTSHETMLHLFKKNKKNWKYFSKYNLVFPDINNRDNQSK